MQSTAGLLAGIRTGDFQSHGDNNRRVARGREHVDIGQAVADV
jgi:hypothetical protein